jgi:hypothetical protein
VKWSYGEVLGNKSRGKSPIMWRFPDMGRCIISYQEVLRSGLKNVNDEADEAVLSDHSINGQKLWTSVLRGCGFLVRCEVFACR